MRILITGGAGFLGKRLVRLLLSQGYELTCLIRPGSDLKAFHDAVETSDGRGTLNVIAGNLNRLDRTLHALPECDVLIHAAAAMTGATANLFASNVIATRQLLDAARPLGVQRIVLISSMGVYGTATLREGDELDETCPLDPQPHLRDPYSYSKIEAEHVAWNAWIRFHQPVVVVRPGVIYGPGRGCLSGRIGLQFGKFVVRMGGWQRVPYTYVDNCAAAIARAAVAPGIEGEAFNIVDDGLPRARQVLATYRHHVQRLRVIPIPHSAIVPLSRLCLWYHQRSYGQLPAVLTPYKSTAMWKRLQYSNAKAKAKLGWKPAIGFEEGLRRTCEWARRDLAERKSRGVRIAS